MLHYWIKKIFCFALFLKYGRCTSLLFVFLFLSDSSQAQLSYHRIRKSYALLNSGNFQGFAIFIKKYQRRHPADVAVYFGWSRYFFDEENSAYNLDSAKHYIVKSMKAFSAPLKKKQLKVYNSLGIRPPDAMHLDKLINSAAYNKADSINTIEAWNLFVNNFNDATERPDAIARRNELAFIQAKDKYDLSSFEQFMKQYPDASEVGEARSLYEELLYRSKTGDSTYQSYYNFMQQYPGNPHYNEAKLNYERIYYREKTKDHKLSSYIDFLNELPSSSWAGRAKDSIYALSTRVAVKENFENFIKSYPTNPHWNEAWIKYFQLSLKPYNDTTIRSFRRNHPDFPYLGIIDKEEMSLIINLKIIQVNDLFGYADTVANKITIPPQFTDANDFSEGLAAVSKKINGRDLYGYINKYGETKIPFIFPYAENFNNGYAIVGTGNCDKDSCHYGIINRIGYIVVPMIYDEMFPFSDGRSLLRKDSLYGFIDTKFMQVVPFKYSDAFSYSEGLAAVETDSGWTFIDKSSHYRTHQYFMKALSFSEGLAAVEDRNELWGFIDLRGNWVIKPRYLQAESFKDGRAKVFVPATKKKNSVKLPKEKYINKNGEFVNE